MQDERLPQVTVELKGKERRGKKKKKEKKKIEDR
jgi:hypothetical protein